MVEETGRKIPLNRNSMAGRSVSIKLYKRFEYLSYWFRYQATYLEMKYHLKQILKGKNESYIKPIYHYDRNIGKSVALARLSAKYNIPVVVPTQSWKKVIEKDVPNRLPKYFKRKRPTTIVANENFKGKRYEILLVEEGLGNDCWTRISPMARYFVGYKNYD